MSEQPKTDLKREALIWLGGALIVALGIGLYALFAVQPDLLPDIYKVL